MPVQFRANATEPLPKKSVEISTATRLLWEMEAEAAVNAEQTGWSNFREALENKGLFILDNEKNQVIFCSPQGGPRNNENGIQQKSAMIQASAEGRLFIRARGTDMLMQLRTNSLSLQNCELVLSEQTREIPGVEGLAAAVNRVPEKPSFWARIAAWFAPNSKYGKKVEAYDNYMEGLIKLPEAQAAGAPVVNEADNQIQNMELNNEGAQLDNQQQQQIEQLNANEQQIQQNEIEQPKENEQQSKKLEEEYPTFGLKKYSKKGLEACFTRMTYSQKAANDAQKSIPETSPVRFDGKELGLLVVMAMASPDLAYTSKRTNNKHVSDPDTTYRDFVGNHLVLGSAPSPDTSKFRMVAERLVGAALKQAATGNYEKLAKIIADGLTHNNKALQNQKELSDYYTGCAELGQMMIKLMDKNDDLKNAVMAKLGDDTKQITIANTAKNISDFRVDAMKTYQEMMKTINVFKVADIKNKSDKVIGQKHIPIVTYNVTDIAKVALLSKIEMDMNFGGINLEDSKFADPNAAQNIVQGYENSAVLDAFQWEKNRGELLQNPKKMKDLFDAATKEIEGALDIKKFERENGVEAEDLHIDQQKLVEDKLDNVGAYLYGEDINVNQKQNNEVPQL